MPKPFDSIDACTLSGVHLTDEELAERRRTTVRTIQRQRAAGLAPPSFKIGGRRLTPIEAVEAQERAALAEGEGGE